MTPDLAQALYDAAAAIASRSGSPRHDAALVLGSGLSDYARNLQGAIEIQYEDIPGFPLPSVAGHSGSLFSVPVNGRRALILAGRAHAYEGGSISEVVFAVRAAVSTGANRIMLTNAAGGCGDGLKPGDLVMISDHLNLAGLNPLVGPNNDQIGPRFPDMSEVYSRRLRSDLEKCFVAGGVTPRDGVYAWFLGPSFETPAEVQMAKRLGADLVGMSTVPEAIAARHMGAEVVAVSLVTNLAAGISKEPITHEEVTEVGAQSAATFRSIIDRFLPVLVEPKDAQL